MSRLIKEDYDELRSFIINYSLIEIISDQNASKSLSACHKKYYAFLVIIEELRLMANETNFSPQLNRDQFAYLQESCSDMGQAFFLTINGCYKGGKLLLRSSIENFLKGVCMDDDSSITLTKSVYEVFDKARNSNAFMLKKNSIHSDLRDIYANLCKDVHTADEEHMSSISSLNHFPSYVKKTCDEIQKTIKRLSNNYITILALKYNQHYHHIGYRNKEIINEEILRDFRKSIQNID